jgi:hypothetical protein
LEKKELTAQSFQG